ncbi:MAG: thymidylate kinase [Fusobacteriaceae bacterium]|jgi:dTMP kinase|nr:thymidylate kinase [Fusobacteriaceae bacterium]
MGKIIVIEGTDASGKETQTARLFEALVSRGTRVRKISFPNYGAPACAPVEFYLSGGFGEDPLRINPYPISAMYAIDRYASYQTDWGAFYREGGVLITDRYVTSNMIHQGGKISDPDEKQRYFEWLEDLEYEKMGIPRPDLVIFLNMPVSVGIQLMKARQNKMTGGKSPDIHEKSPDYLQKAHDTACEVARRYGWREIRCVRGNSEGPGAEMRALKSVEDIGNEILTMVRELL